MPGAGLNVMLKVYILHDMHPGNMWKVGQCTPMHNSFIGCYHRVGFRSLYIRLVYCVFWLGSGVAWGLNIISMIMQTDIGIHIDVDEDIDVDIAIYRLKNTNK